MSVASSAASCLNVRFGGETMTLEQATKKAIADIQTMFNDLEMELILLANAQEQQIDDEEDFRMCVTAEDRTEDLVDGMQYLLGELPEIAAEIRGVPPSKEAKAWFKAHQAERKSAAAMLKAQRKTAEAAEKVARKALTAEGKSA